MQLEDLKAEYDKLQINNALKEELLEDDIANRIDERLEVNDAKEILKVIGDYSKALDLLNDYDHRTLKKIDGNTSKYEYNKMKKSLKRLHKKKIMWYHIQVKTKVQILLVQV